MPDPSDTLFAIVSIETSSRSLRTQWGDAARADPSRATFLRAIDNHQRTLGRLLRAQPLHALGLTLSMASALGALRTAASRSGFAPGSPAWDGAAADWRRHHARAFSLAARDAESFRGHPADAGASARLSKTFALALSATSLSLTLDPQTPLASQLLESSGVEWRSGQSPLRLERLLGVSGPSPKIH